MGVPRLNPIYGWFIRGFPVFPIKMDDLGVYFRKPPFILPPPGPIPILRAASNDESPGGAEGHGGPGDGRGLGRDQNGRHFTGF